VTDRTRAGRRRFRPVSPGSRVALVAPASPFDRTEFETGVAELERLGFVPVYDDGLFVREALVAGPVAHRAHALMQAMTRDDVDAVMAVRGGYGSLELLPALDAARVAARPVAFIGYSDTTSLHAYLNTHLGMTSVHGAMIDGRLARGASAYDSASLLGSLTTTPLGEFAPADVQTLRDGEAVGPILGGTLTQLVGALGTPYDFNPQGDYVLFLEDVNERPYRVRRMLTQLRLSGRLARASAVVVGEMTGCDEPGGLVRARDIIVEALDDFRGPIVFGFPSGHTRRPFVSFPLGVEVRVIARGDGARLVFEEAAAG
jgi:muramoyltetrapeptide carboxypeptidase